MQHAGLVYIHHGNEDKTKVKQKKTYFDCDTFHCKHSIFKVPVRCAGDQPKKKRVNVTTAKLNHLTVVNSHRLRSRKVTLCPASVEFPKTYGHKVNDPRRKDALPFKTDISNVNRF